LEYTNVASFSNMAMPSLSGLVIRQATSMRPTGVSSHHPNHSHPGVRGDARLEQSELSAARDGAASA